MSSIRSGSVGKAVFAFSAVSTLSIVAFLGFTAALLCRKYGRCNALPRWAILCCLLGWLVYFVFMVASFSWSVNSDYSMQERALLVIFSLFPWLPICLNFYVFYGFIHLLLGRTSDSEKPWHRTRVFHWACFIVVVLVACLCSSLNCVLSFGVGRGLFAHLVRITGALPSAIEFATEIVAWVASAENWGWSIFLAVRHPRCVGGHILPTLLLLLATTFWCTAHFLRTVDKVLCYISIRDGITETSNPAAPGLDFVGLAIWGTLGSITILVYWAVILLFCFRWTKLHSKSDKNAQLQPQELPVDSESRGPTYHEMDDQPCIAELPGDYNQLYEADNIQVFEADSSKDKSANAQHSALGENHIL